ncbi:ALP1-like protein [Tanacetum coccineum]
MACCLLHNYIGQEMLIGPFKNKSGCDEGTRDHEVAQEDDNITHDWSLRYSVIDLLATTSVCKVFYPRTSEKFAQLCNQLGLRHLRDDRVMIRAISETKKIHLLYPKTVAAPKKEIGGESISELWNVGEAYEKSSGLHSVVKLILVESGGEDNYFAFDDNLATFIKKLPFLDFNIRIVILRLARNIFYAVFENILEKAGILAKDLITKIVSSDEERLDMVLKHANASEHLYFLKDLSDQIVLGEYDDIDKESEIAFGSSWHIENEVFKEMEDAHKKDKREDDEAKSPYDVRSLEHLLRFITNTLGHPTKRLRGSSKAEDSIKNMVIRATPLYKEYMVQTRSNFEGQIHYEYAS